jgi:hypothetical protein
MAAAQARRCGGSTISRRARARSGPGSCSYHPVGVHPANSIVLVVGDEQVPNRIERDPLRARQQRRCCRFTIAGEAEGRWAPRHRRNRPDRSRPSLLRTQATSAGDFDAHQPASQAESCDHGSHGPSFPMGAPHDTAPVRSPSPMPPPPKKEVIKVDPTLHVKCAGEAPIERPATTRDIHKAGSMVTSEGTSRLPAHEGEVRYERRSRLWEPWPAADQVTKYFACGWWQMIAEVLYSGWNWNPVSSETSRPIRSASRSWATVRLSSRSGQAG